MSRRTSREEARRGRALKQTHSEEENLGAAVGHRRQRIETLLLQELETVLRDESADPLLRAVRPVAVALSVDGRHARMAFVVLTSLSDERRARREASSGLERASGFLRARLAGALELKRVPDLSFTFLGVQPEDAEAPGGDPWRD